MRKFTLLSLLSLVGCMIGPRYEQPQTELAPTFIEQEETTGPAVDLRTWWMQFDDPILNSLIDETIQNNYSLQIAIARVAEVRAQYRIAWAKQLPEIDANVGFDRFQISETVCGQDGSICPLISNLYDFTFDSSWEIDLWGRLRNLTQAAYADLQASEENLRDVYITLLAELTRTYADFRSFQQKIALIHKRIEVGRESLALAEVRYQAGLRAEIEPLQTKSTLDSLQSSLPPLETQMHASLYAIAVLLGRQPEQISESWLAPQPIPQAKGKIPVGLPSDLLRRRPDIRQAERKLAAATARVGAAIALFFPTFSLTGSIGYESGWANQWFTGGSKLWNLAPGLFWPVLDFGKIRAQVDFSKATQREALLNYEQVVIQALENVEDTLVAFSKEEVRLKSLMDQLEALKESRDLTDALYRAGLDSWSSLLDAEQQVLFVEQTVLSSEQALSENLTAVYKALGGEWSCSSMP